MAKIVFGDEFVDQNCVLTSLINVNSPLVFDGTMLGSLKVYAKPTRRRWSRPLFCLAPCPQSPSRVRSRRFWLRQWQGLPDTADSPGCPVIFGTFAAAVSMATGVPTFGTPEPSMVIAAAGADLAGWACPSEACACGSKLPDAQAAYEAAYLTDLASPASTLCCTPQAGSRAAAMGQKNHHGLRPGQHAGRASERRDVSENGQAMSALEEAAGQHFLGSAHTLANFETAFIAPP